MHPVELVTVSVNEPQFCKYVLDLRGVGLGSSKCTVVQSGIPGVNCRIYYDCVNSYIKQTLGVFEMMFNKRNHTQYFNQNFPHLMVHFCVNKLP